MYIYCDNEKFEKLVNTNSITVKIFYYLAEKCRNAGINRVSFSYKELQDILSIGHTSVARSIKTLKELELINKVSVNKGTPEYELPRNTCGIIDVSFLF